MKLAKVEVTGFKSFQKKTTFEFKNNLIGVVGPNGSGKSNIIDAIRWVLGEQSAKNLRGSSMKDVIFSGTEDAKRKNFAEVAVTFSNGEDSCEIKRRLYRNGDSEYYIDNKRAKLKDITDMYLDLGINKESYSIITQGKVEDIISSKPVDRRAIIEEASGVLKYKNKKKETNLKNFFFKLVPFNFKLNKTYFLIFNTTVSPATAVPSSTPFKSEYSSKLEIITGVIIDLALAFKKS